MEDGDLRQRIADALHDNLWQECTGEDGLTNVEPSTPAELADAVLPVVRAEVEAAVAAEAELDQARAEIGQLREDIGRLRPENSDLLVEVERLQAAVQHVRELHAERPGGGFCAACNDGMGLVELWPCATIKALEDQAAYEAALTEELKQTTGHVRWIFPTAATPPEEGQQELEVE